MRSRRRLEDQRRNPKRTSASIAFCLLLLLGGLLGCEERNEVGVSTLMLEAGVRGQLSLSAHPGVGQFLIDLEVKDQGRSGTNPPPRGLRLVSVDGRRLDTMADAHAMKRGWVQFTADSAFLQVGLYMIEVDAMDDHPLGLRRFVLEVLP